jgi:4-amino-4-deoxy-L-arabinose transferase-like glycosyltransferase
VSSKAPPAPARDDEGRPSGIGLVLLLGLVTGLLLFRLGAVPLLGPDEPRYTRVAIEMHRAGDWVRPTLQGQPWLEKPALYYWLAGLGFSVLGETEVAARLPSVLATLLMVGATALFGARLFGKAAGLHAGFILGTSLLTFAYGRAAAMDALLAAGVTGAVGFFAVALLDPGRRPAIPMAYLCMALATLAKGPIGFLLPGLVAVGFVAINRQWRSLLLFFSPLGIALFVLVAGPWYLAAYRALGREFFDVFFVNHNLERFTSTIHRHPGSVAYYLPVLLAGTFPWSGLAVPALAGLRPRRAPAELFVLLWLLLPLGFFSAAGSKLPGYILPCLPPLAMLMGRTGASLAAGRSTRSPWLRAGAALTLVLGLVLGAGPFLLARRGEPTWPWLLPAAAFGLALSVLAAERAFRAATTLPRVLRTGAAGFLLLLPIVLPPVLDSRESGRRLFVPAEGQQVLAWGAWRTAWMAGYFYNDARVRPIEGLAEVAAAAQHGPALLLCGPAERRQLEQSPGLVTRLLAEGPRSNVLLEVRERGRRPGA